MVISTLGVLLSSDYEYDDIKKYVVIKKHYDDDMHKHDYYAYNDNDEQDDYLSAIIWFLSSFRLSVASKSHPKIRRYAYGERK